MKVFDWLKLSEVRSVRDIDDPGVTLLHAEIIRNKPFLKRIYLDFYRQFLRVVPEPTDKVLVEIGSGGGFIKEVIGNVITSDVLDLPNVDRVFSAIKMPFEDASVDAFFMIDVLHHIADSKEFFSEILRSLKVGGKVVMIEPANTLWSRFVYKNFHHEYFNPADEWGLEQSKPLSVANGALPWIIFSRDRERFYRLFPCLRIVRIHTHTPLLYLLSGGMTLRQLIPSFTYPAFKIVELILSPFNKLLGMFQTIELEKTMLRNS